MLRRRTNMDERLRVELVLLVNCLCGGDLTIRRDWYGWSSKREYEVRYRGEVVGRDKELGGAVHQAWIYISTADPNEGKDG
jgi:hypothetical protein